MQIYVISRVLHIEYRILCRTVDFIKLYGTCSRFYLPMSQMHMYTLYSSYASLEYNIQNDRCSQNRFALGLIAFKRPVMSQWLRSSFLSLFPAGSCHQFLESSNRSDYLVRIHYRSSEKHFGPLHGLDFSTERICQHLWRNGFWKIISLT